MAEITINPFGVGGETPNNIGIVNDLTTGGADKALSAEQGKLLGNAAKTGVYMADGEDGPADVDITFDDGDIVSGARIAAGAIDTTTGLGGIAVVSANGSRATVNKVYYCGDGDAPSGTEKFDLSKLKSFTSPSGFKASPTFAASLQQNASAVYPTGWQSGTYSFTDANRTAAEGKPYMVWNFSKGSGSDTIGSSDIAALVAGFKITLEGEAIEPVFTQHKALSIVDEEGDEVFAMSSPAATEGGETEIYSKDAVDGLLAGLTPGGGTTGQSSKVRRALRVTHWNVGQFSLGAASQGTQLTTNFVKKWQNKLRQIGADVMLMCEFYTDNDKVSSIFSDYVYQNTDRLESSGNYIWSAIMSNIALGNVERVVFNNQSYRNFLAATISIGKWSVTLIECHLYFNGSETATRAAQMQQIIDYCANIDRVIICGDFNNADITEYAVFKNAGYQMFNYDLYDRVNTYPATGLTDTNYTSGYPSLALDNIMCKGCSIVAAEVVDDGSLTDHCGVVCDIVLDDLTE